MAIWPFKKKGQRPGTETSTFDSGSLARKTILGSNVSRAVTEPQRGGSKRKRAKRRTSSQSLKQNNGRNTARLNTIAPLSPMGSSFIRPPTRDTHHSIDDNITALPQGKPLRTSPHLRPVTRNDADIPYDFQPYSLSRLHTPKPKDGAETPQRHKLSREPSRRFRNPVSELPTKLTKSRPKDIPKDSKHVREEDFRAMSAPSHMPRRPGGEDTGILRRDSQRMREGLNRKFQRPVSDISLPRPDSRPSTRKSDYEEAGRNYRISVFDVLAPRPIVRPQDAPYSMLAIGWSAPPSRANSGRWSNRQTVSSRAGKQPFVPTRLKRVDDLADEMDSGDIRAIMERDRKRKEEKKVRDAERLRRRLERRAEKDEKDETEGGTGTPDETKKSGSEDKPKRSKSGKTRRSSSKSKRKQREKAARAEESSPKEEARTVKKSELEEIRRRKKPSTSEPTTYEDEERSTLSPLPKRRDGTEMVGVKAEEESIQNPFETGDVTAGANPFEGSDDEEVQIPHFPAFASSTSIADETPLPSPISSSYPLKHKLSTRLNTQPTYSESTEVQKAKQPLSATPSVTALPPVLASPEKKKRRPSLLFSFFRRGEKGKARQRSLSESSTFDEKKSGTSFVNVTRDQKRGNLTSIPGSQSNTPAPLSQPLSRHTPTRSQSRFHENFPKLDAEKSSTDRPPSPPLRIHSPRTMSRSPELHRSNMVTPISSHRTSDKSALLPITQESDEKSKSPTRQQHPFTQSLASIDSEGSWLAGKSAKRMLSGSGKNLEPSHETEGTSLGDSTPRARQSSSDDGPDVLLQDQYFRNLAASKLTGDTVFEQRRRSPKRSQASSKALLASKVGNDTVTPNPIQVAAKKGTMTVHGDLAKQASIQTGLRVKSSEGLLKEMLNAQPGDEIDPDEVDSDSHYDTPKSQKTEDRHDSSMPDMESMYLDESDDSDALELQRARSVRTGKLLEKDARIVDVAKNLKGSREVLSELNTPKLV